MSKLLSILRSGDKDHWKQQVSMAIDAVVAALGAGGGGGSLLTELDILQTKRSGSDQVGVSTGTDVVLNNVVFTRGTGITYDFNTGIYTLAANKIYELDAWGYVYNFSDAASGEVAIEWVDANTNTPIFASVIGVFHPMSMNPALGDSPRVHALYGSNVVTQLKLRVTDGTGTADITTAFGAVVKQLR